MHVPDIDLRFAAMAVVAAPFAAFLMGRSTALALGGAFLALAVLALAVERRSHVDAPGTEAGMATLFLWASAVVLGTIGTVTVALAWRIL